MIDSRPEYSKLSGGTAKEKKKTVTDPISSPHRSSTSHLTPQPQRACGLAQYAGRIAAGPAKRRERAAAAASCLHGMGHVTWRRVGNLETWDSPARSAALHAPVSCSARRHPPTPTRARVRVSGTANGSGNTASAAAISEPTSSI